MTKQRPNCHKRKYNIGNHQNPKCNIGKLYMENNEIQTEGKIL